MLMCVCVCVCVSYLKAESLGADLDGRAIDVAIRQLLERQAAHGA